MKTFSRHRSSNDIRKQCEAKGFKYDQRKFDAGSDYVGFQFRHGRVDLWIVYNTCNGRGLFEYKKRNFSTDTTEFESKRWFQALLEFIYVS